MYARTSLLLLMLVCSANFCQWSEAFTAGAGNIGGIKRGFSHEKVTSKSMHFSKLTMIVVTNIQTQREGVLSQLDLGSGE